jgi:SAM-dependent methyltransferase
MFADADAYERFMGRWSRLLAPALIDFTGLPGQGRILDAGSGTGSLAVAIAERNGRVRVLGIDPSKEYVAYATSRNRFSDHLSFELGDAQHLRFPDASFDAALSLLVFNFIPDANKAIFELRRVTKPGGKISAGVWDYGAGMRMLRTFWDSAVAMDPEAKALDENHMPLCRAGELPALWKQAGLENVREQSIDIPMRFKSFTDYWDPFLLGQGPAGSYVRRLDRHKLKVLREEVKKRLSLPSDHAAFVLSARAWSVCGTVPDRS